jgi:hypothetical protein
MFQLTLEEKAEVVANCDHLARLRFSSALPYAFTEHGAIMLASVLNTPRATEASVFVVRAYVKLREVLATHKDLARKVEELERKFGTHNEAIQSLVRALRQLTAPTGPSRKQIGFEVKERRASYRRKALCGAALAKRNHKLLAPYE